MRTAGKILLTLILMATTLPNVQAVSKKGYKLVWEDDFTGTSLNRDWWNVEINGTGCGNNELQYYIDSPDNVSVRDGNLVLTARRTDYDGHSFTSGRINTHDKVTFTYGIVEARIKLPKTADGLWPAFWMMGNNISTEGWPRCGETDILEMGHFDGIHAGTQERLFNGAFHWGQNPAHHRQLVGTRTNTKSLQDGHYHTFMVVWTADGIDMYVDGDKKPYLSVSRIDIPEFAEHFTAANFILFNLAVGGDYPDIHTADGITAFDHSAEMLVDWVRVYQKKGADNLTINNKLTVKND